MASLPKFKLHDGQHMPTVGIGCWIGKAGEADEVTNMVATALRLGYRHIDTASNYGIISKSARQLGI
ncbi:hypothetical protein E1B28_004848 [Marasmius oreades]|uniref:Aldo/keto reductase n=1 Tax=Marasmius oreades TaxID=181124 RepID=A0A9P7UZE0_9AGAR|nr:uncharacterized protein E1B28_004848 [Marasmius oreades]KAG7097506.1 hypothetical protein E1B28_004848 [Marasmius oreades]